ncbi:MAG: hypothetical protein AAFU49_02770 [Pseudomonadota bacterium]
MIWWVLGIGGGVVLLGTIWLRRAQMRFEAGLRAEGDPLAEHRGTKDYRQRFTAWLFGMGNPESGSLRTVITAIWLVALGVAAAWSLLPAEVWE